jgi:hypothetical protein
MVIEMYDDMIRISHGFEGCQLSIADTCNSAFRAGIMDITSFFDHSKFLVCWRDTYKFEHLNSLQIHLLVVATFEIKRAAAKYSSGPDVLPG